MSKNEVYASFAHSFLWVLLLAAATVAVSSTTHLLFFDLAHGNPPRTQRDVVALIAAQTPFICLVTAIGSLLIFALPQAFQTALVAVLHRTSRARFAVLP